jgi:hypothetical protein
MVTAPALSQQMTPSQLALSINQAVAQMAQQIERQQVEIEQLKKELAEKERTKGEPK